MKPERLTISVPEAGARYFGLSRNGSYAAVGRGEIPTVRIGKPLRVPVRAMEELPDGAKSKASAVVDHQSAVSENTSD